MHHVRRGAGRPLLLVHGLGSTWRAFDRVLPALAAEREVIAVDLPGHGDTRSLDRPPTVAALADALEAFLADEGLTGIDAVGSSLGGRLVLELARRGRVGATVALDPGGFWSERQRFVFALSLRASVALVRALQPVVPALAGNPVTRTALLAQLSARPWALPAGLVERELRSLAHDPPALDATLAQLVRSPTQQGIPSGAAPGRITLGWGRRDRVTFRSQAATAAERFPDALLHWFARAGHFPQWDAPEETARLVLERTG